MKKITTKKRIAGFTITEIMVSVTIVAILTAIAAPNYITYLANHRAYELAMEINAAITMAKNEAVHRGLSVELCGLTSTNSGNCNHFASKWNHGWQIAILPLNTVAHTYQPPAACGAIKVSPASSIIFAPSGFPNPQAFTITIKPKGCSQGYLITYNASGATGRLSTQLTTCP